MSAGDRYQYVLYNCDIPEIQIQRLHKAAYVFRTKRRQVLIIGNISAKKISKFIHIHQSYSKPKVGRFSETRCILCSDAMSAVSDYVRSKKRAQVRPRIEARL